MTPNRRVSEPCAFQTLQLAVCEDAGLITRQFDKLVADRRAWENHPQPQYRAEFKRIFEAGTTLKDAQKRRAIVSAHADSFAEFVSQFCAALRGSPITTDNRQFLVEQGQAATFHLAPELSSAIVHRTLASSGTIVDGHNPLPAAPPTLVVQLVADVVDDCPRLRWQRPAQGCDRLVIRAAENAYPVDDTDGREVFDGSGEECLDTRASPGRMWYYSAFSYSRRHSSSPESAKVSQFFGPNVTNLQAAGGLQQIAVSWQPPAVDYRDIIVFRWRAGSEGVAVDGYGRPRALPETIERRLGRTSGFVDDVQSGITPGELYEYRVFVDYGFVGGHHRFSPGQSIAAAALRCAFPVTKLSLQSTEAGVTVSWEMPPARCDGVIVVRSSHHIPEHARDGVSVSIDRGNRYTDAGLAGGALYHYAVFSVYQGQASACTAASVRYAPPPSGFTADDPVLDPGYIHLRWSIRNSVRGLRLFRKKGARPAVVTTSGAPAIVDGEEVPLAAGRPITVRDRVAPEVEYHYALFAEYEAGTWSPAAFTSASAVKPTPSVTTVDVNVSREGHVSLSWSAPTSLPAATMLYHVWRRERVSDGAAHAAERISTTEQRSYVNRPSTPGDPPVPGRCYEYAIQAAIGPVQAELSPWAEVFVTRDVVLKSAIGVNGSVALEWTAPPNAVRVEVTRDGTVVVPSTLTHAQDGGLSPGLVYPYWITAVFSDENGNERRAPGVRATARPVAPAGVVCNLRARYERDVVLVSWLLPASVPEAIVVSRSDDPPGLDPGAFVDRSTLSAVAELPGDANLFADDTAALGGVHFYAVYTLNGWTATYCGTVAAPLFAAIKELQVKNAGNRMWLTWTWPDGADLVRITRRPSSGSPATVACTRRQYESAPAAFVDMLPERPDRYVYDVRVVGLHGTTRFESLLGCSKAAAGGILPEIVCSATKRRNGFEVTCNLAGVAPGFGGLALVGSNIRDPLSIDEGQIVDRFVPNGTRLRKTAVLQDTRDGGLYRYYQVFLLEPDPLKSMVKLVAPPLSNRLCE